MTPQTPNQSAADGPSDFDEIIDRSGSFSFKWNRYRNRDIIPLWVADMDFRSPRPVIEALRQRADHGIFGYTLPPDELIGVVIDTLRDRYRWTVEPSWLVWLPGLVTGLNVSCRAVGEAGDDIMTTTPVYPPFLSAPHFSGRRCIEVPLALEGERWEFDFKRIEAALTSRTGLFLLCHPHNPVGRVYSRKELTELAKLCLKHNIVLCSDEIHCDLILDPEKRHVPAASLDPEIADRTITLMAPSKTFNLPGLGCSFAIISNAKLRRRYREVMNGIVPHVNAMGFEAALAAYNHGWPWLSDLIEYLRENRNLVASRISRMPGLATYPVEATYLAWIDAREAGLDRPVRFFESAGVGLSDGAEFGAMGFLRLNFGCPRSRLEAALGRMEAALS